MPEDPGAAARQESECTPDLQAVLHGLKETHQGGEAWKVRGNGGNSFWDEDWLPETIRESVPLAYLAFDDHPVYMIQLLQDELNI